MAIKALDGVDVVTASRVREVGVHLLDVEAAIGKTGMTGAARGSGVLLVALVTGKAAQTFVYADGRSIVSGHHGVSGERRVALIAQALTRIGTGLDGARAVEHRGNRKRASGDVGLTSTIEERQRGTNDALFTTVALAGLGCRLAGMMNRVARHARDCRTVRHFFGFDSPRTFRIDGLNHRRNASFEVHSMAAEAIVHQAALFVVFGVGEDSRIGCAVRTGLPFGVLLLVAGLAAFDESVDVL